MGSAGPCRPQEPGQFNPKRDFTAIFAEHTEYSTMNTPSSAAATSLGGFSPRPAEALVAGLNKTF